MKKITAIALSLVLSLATVATAFAADATGVQAGGSATNDVTATYKAGDPTQTVYSVDIAWTNLSFTYTAASEGTWQPSTHTYVDPVAASWSTGTITVTNHSNAAVTATPSYQQKSGYQDVSMTFNAEGFSNGSFTVATADNGLDGAAGSAVSKAMTVTPNGDLAENTKNAVIGTITVAIS